MILSRIRASQGEALAKLMEDSWGELVDRLSWILGSWDAAEDVAQEAFVRLWEHRERWEEGSAQALVFCIGRNLAIDALRRERVRQKRMDVATHVVHQAADPAALADSSELERRFRKALSSLSPGRREAFEMVRMEGLTHREAAEALEISKQTVANRMTLALATLRIQLADALPDLRVGKHTERSCNEPA